MERFEVKMLRPGATLPHVATAGAHGYDGCAAVALDRFTREVSAELPYTMQPGEVTLFGLGCAFRIPRGYEIQIRPRSGLATKQRIELANTPGTGDSDYRGEITAALVNKSDVPFEVKRGDRICQLVFARVLLPVLEVVDELPVTVRGKGGFGSTGLSPILTGATSSAEEQRLMDEMFLRMADAAKIMSQCSRGKTPECPQGTRRFGCVVARDGNVIAVGYNAFLPGQSECSPTSCIRETLGVPSGTSLEVGGCGHAESFAIAKLARQNGGGEGSTFYVTGEPCVKCAKDIILVGARVVVMPAGMYPTNGTEILRQADLIVRYIELAR